MVSYQIDLDLLASLVTEKSAWTKVIHSTKMIRDTLKTLAQSRRLSKPGVVAVNPETLDNLKTLEEYLCDCVTARAIISAFRRVLEDSCGTAQEVFQCETVQYSAGHQGPLPCY